MQFLQVITGQEQLCKNVHTVNLTFCDLQNHGPIMIDMFYTFHFLYLLLVVICKLHYENTSQSLGINFLERNQ